MRVQHITQRWITVAEAAQRLHVGMNHMYNLLMAGQLEGEKQGKRWRVSAQAVEQRRQRLHVANQTQQEEHSGKTKK